MSMKFHRWILFGVVILTFFLLSACSGPDEHIWLKSSGWSRAVFLGNTNLNDPVSMTLDDDGQVYFIFLSANEDDETKFFELLALDPSGLPLWTHSLAEITVSLPDNPQILWENEKLQLFWIDNHHLYTLSLDSNGTPLDDEAILLSAEIEVDSYSVAVDDSGRHTLFFAGARQNPGVYALSTSDGKGEIVSIAPDGIRVQLRYDQENTLHATWLDYPLGYGRTKIFYANYPKKGEATAPQILIEKSINPSNAFDGPIMGIDTENIFVFWTESTRTGLDAGSIKTNYLYFPLGDATSASEVAFIAVPSGYDLEFASPSQEFLLSGERAFLAENIFLPTIKVQEIVPNPVQTGELAIIFRSPMEYLWRKVHEQVNIAYFQEGKLTSYQPLSFTTTLSTSPYLLNSPEGYLYATWLEKIESNRYALYFASTSPEIKETMSRSTTREMGRVAAQVSFGLLVGILMAPIAAGVWVVVPLMVLFLFSPLRKFGSRRTQDIVGIISLVFAIAAFWFGKIAMLPGMFDHVPFSAWVPIISSGVSEILRYGVPLTSMLISLFIAWHYTYRQSNKSTLYFLLIYVGVDSLLTAAIYAVLIYGAI